MDLLNENVHAHGTAINIREVFSRIKVEIAGVGSYSRQWIFKVESFSDFQRQGISNF